jgi:hypothetical protein
MSSVFIKDVFTFDYMRMKLWKGWTLDEEVEKLGLPSHLLRDKILRVKKPLASLQSQCLYVTPLTNKSRSARDRISNCIAEFLGINKRICFGRV